MIRPLLLLLGIVGVARQAAAHGHHHRHLQEDNHSDNDSDNKHQDDHIHSASTCGTRSPNEEERLSATLAAQEWLERNPQHALAFHQGSSGRQRGLQLSPSEFITIPICFHVIRPQVDFGDGANYLDNEQLQRELDLLQQTYSSQSCCDISQPWCVPGTCSVETGFRFAMAFVNAAGEYDPTAGTTTVVGSTSSTTGGRTCQTRTINETWYDAITNSQAEKEMKRALRKGDGGVLNVYYKQSDYIGHATFPHEYNTVGKLDGVVIKDTTIIGGSDASYNEGVRNSRNMHIHTQTKHSAWGVFSHYMHILISLSLSLFSFCCVCIGHLDTRNWSLVGIVSYL